MDEERQYKKLAGTAAVFILADHTGTAPVERSGMVWQGSELHFDQWPDEFNWCEDIGSPLALEGLEAYDPPAHGDARRVLSMDMSLVYLQGIRGWVQISE